MIEDEQGLLYHYMIEPRSGKVDDPHKFSVFDEPTIKRIWDYFSTHGRVWPNGNPWLTEVASTEMERYVIWRSSGGSMYLNRWEVYRAEGEGYDILIEIDFDLVLKGDHQGVLARIPGGGAGKTEWALWRDQHQPKSCWACWYIEQRRNRFCVGM